MLTFPEVQVGDPLRYEALAVFPLFALANVNADYLLSDEALAAGTVTVEEVGQAGSVPTLVVNNQTGNKIVDPNLMWDNGYGIYDGTTSGAPVITSATYI